MIKDDKKKTKLLEYVKEMTSLGLTQADLGSKFLISRAWSARQP